jgi:hypothetical protein
LRISTTVEEPTVIASRTLHRVTIATLAAWVAALIVSWPAPASAQTATDAGAAVTAAMEPLSWLVGEWEGEGWSESAGGRSIALVTERVESRLDGRVLFVEGIGHVKEATGSPGEVVHHAVGVLSYDPARAGYLFLAFRDGRVVEARTSLEDGVFVWGFDVPGGQVRYRIRQDAGDWLESGDFSRDGGATWRPFFEMRLHRTGAP